MAIEDGVGHAAPSWFATPGQTDILAWVALGLICLALYGIVTLYAAFDRWAEHKAHGTPLAKTIPTMLAIALLYEIFPLEHFHVLLPVSAILLALSADWARFHVPSIGKAEHETAEMPAVVDAARPAAEDAKHA
ncbi:MULTISPECIES: hypothetical protein [Bosea]|jgi:hypothetical protein|uniref:hypothetical protein n=1 Tax=Bosea TaxID=85413 RepID=UPI000A48CAD9|nr:hypothetical protein [Bosea vaviloviae]